MASLFYRCASLASNFFGSSSALFQNVNNILKTQPPARYNWADWRMMKDFKRRNLLVQHGAERLRLKALKKNDLLPQEILEVGYKQLDALPRDSSIVRIRNRCAITSRSRGVVKRWRLSRIVWRHLADYNKLSGVQRAIW